MFTKPNPGEFVTATVNWSDIMKTSVVYVQTNHSIQVISGKVVPSSSWDDPASFSIATGNPNFPVAVIPMKRVTDLSYGSGAEATEIIEAKQEEFETWTVQGSKESYTVTRRGDSWSCECKGWQFRSQCKHVNEKKQEVLDRNK